MVESDGGLVAEVMRLHGHSAQPESAQVVAVLSAMTEVVKGEQLTVTPTSLFAAAMSALEKPETQAAPGVCLAVCTVLGFTLPRVPNATLRLKFVGCAAIIIGLLERHRSDAQLCRAALLCLSQLLAALDPGHWPSAAAPWAALLSFVLDNRPKVRKRAHSGVIEVLASLQATPALAPACDAISRAASSVLPGPEAAARAAAASSNKQRSAAEAAISKAVADTLHLLGLLKGCVALMTAASTKVVVDLLFKLYPLKQHLLSRHATEVLTALCNAPSGGDKGGAGASHLSPATLAEILQVVLDAEDQLWDRKDADAVLSLTRLVEAGFLRLAKADPKLCASRLPRAFHVLVPQLCATQEGVRFGTSQCLRNLIVDCIDSDMVASAATGGSGKKQSPLVSCVAAVEAAMGPRYQESWPLVMPVVGTLLERIGELSTDGASSAAMTSGLLVGIGNILAGAQDADDDRALLDASSASASAAASAAEDALGRAMRSLGPEAVLAALPLNLDSAGTGGKGGGGGADGAAPRTWLLPLLRRHVSRARLGHWVDTLLPLARTLAARSQAASIAGQAQLSQALHVLELQLWHCLPGFASWAGDLPACYGRVVKDVAGAFQNREDLRPAVGQALRRMYLQVRRMLKSTGHTELIGPGEPLGTAADDDEGDEYGGGGGGGGARGGGDQEDELHAVPPEGYGEEEALATHAALQSFTRNWLVLMFKVFLEQAPHERGPTAAVISAVASLADAPTMAQLFRAVITKFIKIGTDAAAPVPPSDMITDGGLNPTERRCAFLELALATASGLQDGGLLSLLKAAKPGLADKEPAVQKKAYKVLAHLCEHRPDFVRSHLGDVLPSVIVGSDGALSASRRYRLRVVQPLVLMLTSPGCPELPPLRKMGSGADGADSDEDEDVDAGMDEGGGSAEVDDIVVGLVSEIVLCVKEANTKTRAVAYGLLVALAHGMEDADPQSDHIEADADGMEADDTLPPMAGGLHRLFSMVLAGLVSVTPHMQSAAVMALARLLYEFAGQLQSNVPRLLPPVLMLLRTKSREVVKSVLGFVKVCAMRMPVEMLTVQLVPILEGLLLWADDSKNKFKLKIRVVVERLARRCGFDAVAAAMPPSDSKLLTHIRKQHNRKERKRADSKAGSDDEDEDGGGDARSQRSGATGLTGRSSMGKTARPSEWGHSKVFGSDGGPDSDDGTRAAGGSRASGAGGRKGAASEAGAGGWAAKGKGRADRDGGNGPRLADGGADGDPINLLDAGASRQLSRAAARAGQRGGGEGARRGDVGEGDGGYRRDGAGKYVIGEDEEELRRPGRKGAKGGKRGRDGDDGGYASDDSDFDDLRDVADLSYAMRKEGAKSVQIGRSLANGSVGGKSVGGKSAGGKSMGGRSEGGKSAGGRSTDSAAGGRKGPVKHSGDRFKPKKSNTGGDTKGKAAVEPYAYWQFDRKMLNRRKSKQATASKSLTTVVRAAKAGAARGAKARRGGAGAGGGGKRQRTATAE